MKVHIIKRAAMDGTRVIAEKIVENLTEAEAFAEEIRLIALYGRRDIGTGILANHTNGGEGASGGVISESTKAKLSAAMKGRKVSDGMLGRTHRIETREKMSQAATGVPSGLMGKRRKPEDISAISATKRSKNPAWVEAEKLFKLWKELGEPNPFVFKKNVSDEFKKCDSLIREFKKGWNPSTNRPENA